MNNRMNKSTASYDDIINIKYPDECKDGIKHPPMSIRDRAKIFASFAALKGYEDGIDERAENIIEKVNLHTIEKEKFED